MAALAKDRNTKMTETGRLTNHPVAANAVIYKGALVSSNATGFAVPSTDTASEIVLGIAQFAVDNTGGANGDEDVTVQKGVAELENGGTVVDQADAGRPVYALDDQTVSKAAGVTNNIVVGTLEKFDPDSGKPLVKLTDPTV